jgi:hypothetical protein
MNKIPYLTFNFIIIYKTFIEICGHIGKKLYPIPSFSQFIWIPKLFNIQLYAEDHDLHHTLNNCNYSKKIHIMGQIINKYKYINFYLELYVFSLYIFNMADIFK